VEERPTGGVERIAGLVLEVEVVGEVEIVVGGQ